MNYINIFQNAQALSVSIENNYPEDQFMHIYLENYHQGGKYSAQIASHPAELRREENFMDQIYLSITSLQTDFLIIDIRAGCSINSERASNVQKKYTFGKVGKSAMNYIKIFQKAQALSFSV